MRVTSQNSIGEELKSTLDFKNAATIQLLPLV